MNHHYGLEVPVAWSDVVSESDITLYPPDDTLKDYRRPYVLILIGDTLGLPPEKYNDFWLKMFAENFDDFPLTDQGTKIIDGRPCWWTRHICTRGGNEFTFLIYIIHDRGRVIKIIATSLSQSYPKYAEDFVRTIESLKIQSQ